MSLAARIACIGPLVSEAGQPRVLPLDGNKMGNDLDGIGRLGVRIRPARNLVQVIADAGDLSGLLARGAEGRIEPYSFSR